MREGQEVNRAPIHTLESLGDLQPDRKLSSGELTLRDFEELVQRAAELRDRFDMKLAPISNDSRPVGDEAFSIADAPPLFKAMNVCAAHLRSILDQMGDILRRVDL